MRRRRHLRRPMLPDKVIDPGMIRTQAPPPTGPGGAYALRVLSGPGGVIPTSVGRRTQGPGGTACSPWAQTTVRGPGRPRRRGGVLPRRPRGAYGITLAVAGGSRPSSPAMVRLFLPVTIAAAICLVCGGRTTAAPPSGASLTVPLACPGHLLRHLPARRDAGDPPRAEDPAAAADRQVKQGDGAPARWHGHLQGRPRRIRRYRRGGLVRESGGRAQRRTGAAATDPAATKPDR